MKGVKPDPIFRARVSVGTIEGVDERLRADGRDHTDNGDLNMVGRGSQTQGKEITFSGARISQGADGVNSISYIKGRWGVKWLVQMWRAPGHGR